MIKRYFIVILSIFFIVSLTGCEAFVRKFTRKPNKEMLPREEMVLVPEEYKGPNMTKEELYRQYFLFWKSWHDELIESLAQKKSKKKQINCAQEMLKNLYSMADMLVPKKEKELEFYIGEAKNLLNSIEKDIYSNNATFNVQRLERLKRNILEEFSYNNIKGDML